MKLANKVAIVTGSSQGIGRGYALRLAQDGAKIVIADVNEEKGISVQNEMRAAGYEAQFIKVDVSNEDSVNRMAEETVRVFGKIDILVNNAAIFSTIKMKPFEEISLQEWNLIMNVNMTGVFLCCKAVVPYMRQDKFGRIINISSGTALSGRPNYLHYVTTKSGVIGFTRALAREVGIDNITVNTVAPGPIYTEVERETVSKEQADAMIRQQCIQRPGTPEDMVGIISFLCSDEAGYISGQMMLVDGGKGMH